MIEAQEIRGLLDGLARRFENRVHREATEREVGVAGASGWGQFLDDPTAQTQVGPYGTGAGLIVRALAKRGDDQLAEQVGTSINAWWDNRDKDDAQRKLFAQITRLAMTHLAVRVAGLPSSSKTLTEIRAVLLNAIRPDGMWGNYVTPGKLQDASPRLFSTAITILSFTLFLSESEAVPEELVRAATGLEERLLGSKELPLLHVAAACAAIVSAKRSGTNKRILKRLNRLAYASQPSLTDLGVYFYDYEYVSDEERAHYGRDYFIVPTEILLGIAGFQFGTPTHARLRAEHSLRLLVRNIRGFDGFYRPDNEQRVSSMNQCWVAIFLALAAERRERAIVASGWYNLIRQRSDSPWTDAMLLGLCSGGIVAGIWSQSLPGAQTTGVPAVSLKLCMAVLAFIAGRLYAPAFLKEIFPGRE